MKKTLTIALMTVSGVSSALTVSCGHLFDSNQGKFVQNKVIEIDQDRVVAVSGKTEQSVDLDYTDGYCLPGLIDAHTHLSSQMGPTSYISKFTLNAADVTLNAVQYADRTLQAGFTTVRDLGDSYGVTAALRDAIKAGKVDGPRVYTSGKSLATTGGHADPSNGYRDGLHPPTTPGDGVINGVDEARRAVRQHYQDGADLIKITATGGVLSQASSGDNSQFTHDELDAIINIAHDYGFKVGSGGNTVSLNSGIYDYNIKQDYNWYLNQKNTLKFGWQTNLHQLKPSEFSFEEDAEDGATTAEREALEGGLYISNKQKVSDKLTLNYGLRLSTFSNIGAYTEKIYDAEDNVITSTDYGAGEFYKTHIGVEPRINGTLDEKAVCFLS